MPSQLRVVRRRAGETFADAGPLSRAALQMAMDEREAAVATAKSAYDIKASQWTAQLGAYTDVIDSLRKNSALPDTCTDPYFCTPTGDAHRALVNSVAGPTWDRYVALDRVLRSNVSDDQRYRNPVRWAVEAKGAGKVFDPRTVVPSYAQDMAAAQQALDAANSALQIVAKQYADGEKDEADKAAAAAAKKKADDDAAMQQKILIGVGALVALYIVTQRR